ncbi:MAG: hypothetical protein GY856_07015 [bacterium]|nr:hypothetical protein [bacterium]
MIAASMVFLLINPAPGATVLRHIHLAANVNWVFLSLINLYMIRMFYVQIRETRAAPGFIAFGVVFACIFLWRGSELYLQVYCWDEAWNDHLRELGANVETIFPRRIWFSTLVNEVSSILSSISVGGTFLYLYRLLR